MGKFKDLTGQRFGKLIVIKKMENDKDNKIKWLCKCDCGNIAIVSGKDLQRAHTKSCGCLHEKHSKSETRLYRVWRGMKARCLNSKYPYYSNYGGRGITVCDEWKNDFQVFCEWAMKNGYDEKAPRGECTLDRIDNNGNYEPNNCRWTTNKQQSRNRRTNHLLTYKGKTQNIIQWAEETGISRSVFVSRLQNGWNMKKIINTPVNYLKEKLITYKGITLNMSEWERKMGLKEKTISRRLKRGWTIEKAIGTPIKKDKNIQSQEKNKISEEECMHETQEWEEDFAETQAEFYEQS